MASITVNLMAGKVRGSVRAISQLVPPVNHPSQNHESGGPPPILIGYTIVVYCLVLGVLFGMIFALLCDKNSYSSVTKEDDCNLSFASDSIDNSMNRVVIIANTNTATALSKFNNGEYKESISLYKLVLQ